MPVCNVIVKCLSPFLRKFVIENRRHEPPEKHPLRLRVFAVKNNWQQNTSREKTGTNGNKTYKSPSGDLGVTVTVCNHFP